MKRKNLLALVIVLAMAVCLTGCLDPNAILGMDELTLPPEPENPLELVIIVGSHANAWLSLNDLTGDGAEAADFEELIARTMEYGEKNGTYTARCHVKVIVCDGNPHEVELKNSNGKPLKLYETATNPGYFETHVKKLAREIAEALQSDELIANDEQVDLTAALYEASYRFDPDSNRQKMIYVMDTGVCTMGAMDLDGVDIYGQTTDEIMVGLNSGSFAKLNGIQVEFRNFGDVCGDQQIIRDTVFWETMAEVWRAYLSKCEADPIKIRFDGNEYDANVDQYNASKYPAVDEVPFTIYSNGYVVRPKSAPFDPVLDANLILNDETVGGFEPYDIGASLKPLDEEKARAVAKEVKKYYDTISASLDPNCVFYVIGSCSYPDDNRHHDTAFGALGRAEVIAGYLIDAGIPSDRIRIVDAGTNRLPWRNFDELNEKEKNRVVAIIPSYREAIIEEINTILGSHRVPLNAE